MGVSGFSIGRVLDVCKGSVETKGEVSGDR